LPDKTRKKAWRDIMARHHLLKLCPLIIAALVPAAQAQESRGPGELFPTCKPYETGYLQVSELHSIYYALCGNPEGKPVFVLHGGPGFGCYPRLPRYFNPDKFRIILHDQRGAGRSRPPGETRENTTQDLVADIERLREHLGVDGPFLVFGGSWGSTLALAYAESHPQRVSGMVLRGVWTGTRAELDGVLGDGCVGRFFPQALERMKSAMPPGSEGLTPKAIGNIFAESDDETIRRFTDAWMQFGLKIGQLHATDEEVDAGFGDYDAIPGTRVDVHYLQHRYFLQEGQLLNNALKLRDIPITIINGRYDMFCPPVTAYRLHKLLPRSKLIIVEEAGHSEGEPGTTRALVQAVAEFE
jgi:proline iminopeptidase